MTTLLDFKYKKKICRENGVNGSGSKGLVRTEKHTLRFLWERIRDVETNKIMADLSLAEIHMCARGGKGGKEY